jgi:hypothetical protein
VPTCTVPNGPGATGAKVARREAREVHTVAADLDEHHLGERVPTTGGEAERILADDEVGAGTIDDRQREAEREVAADAERVHAGGAVRRAERVAGREDATAGVAVGVLPITCVANTLCAEVCAAVTKKETAKADSLDADSLLATRIGRVLHGTWRRSRRCENS